MVIGILYYNIVYIMRYNIMNGHIKFTKRLFSKTTELGEKYLVIHYDNKAVLKLLNSIFMPVIYYINVTQIHRSMKG